VLRPKNDVVVARHAPIPIQVLLIRQPAKKINALIMERPGYSGAVCHLKFKFRNFVPRCFVSPAFFRQKACGEIYFFSDATGRQRIQRTQLKIRFRKITLLDPTESHLSLTAKIDSAKAYAPFIGDSPLAHAKVALKERRIFRRSSLLSRGFVY
jgi:hypothetical protein